jgi:Glycine zipper 2TM domain
LAAFACHFQPSKPHKCAIFLQSEWQINEQQITAMFSKHSSRGRQKQFIDSRSTLFRDDLKSWRRVMVRNSAVKSMMIATLAVSALTATPALARHHRGYDNYQYDNNYNNGYYYQNQGYQDRGYRDDRYRGDGYDRNYRCSKGTSGLIIGAIAGGLLGRAVVNRNGDKTAGLIIGAGAGALAGRAVERSGGNRC